MSGRSKVWRWSRSIWLWLVGMKDREVTSVISIWQCYGGEKWEKLEKERVSFFIFNWVSSVCTLNITLREPKRKAMESWYLPLSQGLESHLMALFWVLSKVVGLLRRLDPIPYLVKRQDTAVTQITFYRVAGLKSLANHRLRSYYTYKVWYEGANKSLIECGKAQE